MVAIRDEGLVQDVPLPPMAWWRQSSGHCLKRRRKIAATRHVTRRTAARQSVTSSSEIEGFTSSAAARREYATVKSGDIPPPELRTRFGKFFPPKTQARALILHTIRAWVTSHARLL